jgi:hypothetical protein
MIAGMSKGGRTRVTVEFDSGSDPMSGRMLDEGGGSRAFTGWLGLAAALANVVRNEPSVRPEAAAPPATQSGIGRWS